MKTLIKVLSFLLINAIGFSVGPILLAVSVFGLKIIEVSEENPADLDFIWAVMFSIMITWLVCFIFSFASFFLSGLWRKIFLFAPIYMPFFFALYSIITYLG